MIQSPLHPRNKQMLRMAKSSRTRFLTAAVVVVAVVIFLLFIVSRRADDYVGCDAPFGTVYDVVLDAGSTGSRVHIFKFRRHDGKLILNKESAKRITPGLSSYAGRPDEAASSLAPLLAAAVSTVPPMYRKCTSVTLKATAGLRLLPAAQRDAIMTAVERALESTTPFVNRGVSVIAGNEEGVYAWMTVNYLLGRVFERSANTVTTIDMGGASTQIVFEANITDGEWVPFNYVSHIRLPNRRVTLYHHSYLGFGLNQARSTVFKAAASRARAESVKGKPFPCFPGGYSVPVDGTDVVLRGSSEAGAQDFAACERIVTQGIMASPSAGGATRGGGDWDLDPLPGPQQSCGFQSCGIGGIPQPMLLPEDRDVYAFSYFFDRMNTHLPQGDGSIPVESLKRSGREVCNSPAHAENKKTKCLDLAYLYSYLHEGLGLGDSAPLWVREKIGDRSVSWSLGASLLYLLKADSF